MNGARYYGTAVPGPALEVPAPAPVALVDVVWCELAGCPAGECAHCRNARAQERVAVNAAKARIRDRARAQREV